jgi:probable rRNA maturation factor
MGTLHDQNTENTLKKHTLPSLELALQFALPDAAMAKRHRAALTRAWAQRCVAMALERPGSVTVRVVGADEGRALNLSYRGRDYATNVLTFDYATAPAIEADLVLCAPVVEAEARAQRRTLRDHYAHLLVHGTLHAQGWDHETSAADADTMESAEILLLGALGVANPYR